MYILKFKTDCYQEKIQLNTYHWEISLPIPMLIGCPIDQSWSEISHNHKMAKSAEDGSHYTSEQWRQVNSIPMQYSYSLDKKEILVESSVSSK